MTKSAVGIGMFLLVLAVTFFAGQDRATIKGTGESALAKATALDLQFKVWTATLNGRLTGIEKTQAEILEYVREEKENE